MTSFDANVRLPDDERTTRTRLSALLGAALAFRLALVPLLRNKQTHDLRIFVSWAQLLERYGTHGLYRHVDTIDHYPVNYPPLFAIVLGLVDAAYRPLIGRGGDNLVLLGMLLKLPAIVADIAICGCVFLVIRRWAGPRAALGAVALAAFAPSTWPISAVWGQVDSLCSAFMLAALVLVFARRYALAWCALALAVLVKPLPIVIAPLLSIAQYRECGWTWKLVAGPLCALLIAYAVSVPFAPTLEPLGVLGWLGRQYAGGQALSDATSVNAYNLWTLAWPVTSDSRVALGLTLHAWGWLGFALVLVVTSAQLARRLALQTGRVGRERPIAQASFVTLVAVFTLLTRMHERYILFALTLVPLMWFCGRWRRWPAVTLLVTFTLCVTLVLGFYEHSWIPENQTVTHLLSFVNLFAFAAVTLSFFERTAVDPPGRTARKQVAESGKSS